MVVSITNPDDARFAQAVVRVFDSWDKEEVSDTESTENEEVVETEPEIPNENDEDADNSEAA